MPKQSKSISRGSIFLFTKQKLYNTWKQLITNKIDKQTKTKVLSKQYGISINKINRRLFKYKEALDKGKSSEESLHIASSDKRGGHNKIFTKEQENELSNVISSSSIPLTHDNIKQVALQFKIITQLNHPHHNHLTRSSDTIPFSASDGWITDFKRRNDLISRRTNVKPIARFDMSEQEKKQEEEEYINQVKDNIALWGRDYVFNMDETPLCPLETPTTAVVKRSSSSNTNITPTYNHFTLHNSNTTCFPTISASGRLLHLCFVIKGKTSRCLRKIYFTKIPNTNKIIYNSFTSKIKLYYSHKGWVNEGIMIKYFKDVIYQHTQGRPCALILDDYRAHWTDEVKYIAEQLNIKLIHVPKGMTSSLQPLDVNFNGPFKMKRKSLYQNYLLSDSDQQINQLLQVKITQQSYSSLSSIVARKAFKLYN